MESLILQGKTHFYPLSGGKQACDQKWALPAQLAAQNARAGSQEATYQRTGFAWAWVSTREKSGLEVHYLALTLSLIG
jgi:hypothetical protein